MTVQEDSVAGALYSPLELIVPQVLDHATVVFVLPVTVAVNCSVAFTSMESDAGLIVITIVGAGDTAPTVTLAEAENAGLAKLVAVTVQEDGVAGAVYSPLKLMVPQVLDQATVVFVLPVTVAVNCSVEFISMEPDAGLMVITIVGGGGAGASTTVTLAEAETAGLTKLVAVTVQEEAVEGAL